MSNGEAIQQPHFFRIGGVKVYVNRDLSFIRTEFPGGAQLDATPNFTEEDIARAISLGYRGDTRLMSAEHEITHSLLAHAIGRRYSATLYHAASGSYDPGHLVRAAEEAIVLALQALANGQGVGMWTEVLRLFDVSPTAIVSQLLRIRKTLLSDHSPSSFQERPDAQ